MNVTTIGWPAVGEGRWLKAQRLELAFWRRWETLAPYAGLDLSKYWQEEIAHFGANWESFRGLRMLDVGCGPLGLIHFADQAAERIRLDPLLTQYERKPPLTGAQLSLSAVGESIPLSAGSVDLVVCFNSLDHMRDPSSAIAEMARVLRPGGRALFMIHTFPAWLRPLYWADRLHPHHYTAPEFSRLLAARFQIERAETVRRRFEVPLHQWCLPSSWKYMAANFVVSSTYVRCRAA
jgi:ubiquinone/menaquinone biosynthesis C-methylase UbiE